MNQRVTTVASRAPYRLVRTSAAVVLVLCTLAGCALPGRGAVAATQAGDSGSGVDPALVAELTVDGMAPLACGFAPIDVMAATPGAENGDSPEARGLRKVIDETQGSMSPQDSNGWVEMWRKGDTIEYGRRTGALGISYVLGVTRHGEQYDFDGSFPCGTVGYADRRADSASVYVDRGDHLEVHYDADSCDPRLDDVRVYEKDRYVDLLLLRPKPLRDAPECVGTGADGTVTAPLLRPLGDRTVRNIGYVPAQTMPSWAEDEARQARDAAAQPIAERLCRAAADAMHTTVTVATHSDVASVRAAVPATRNPWGELPGTAVAGDCYLANDDGSNMAVVAADGVDPVVRRAHHTSPAFDAVPQLDGPPEP